MYNNHQFTYDESYHHQHRILNDEKHDADFIFYFRNKIIKAFGINDALSNRIFDHNFNHINLDDEINRHFKLLKEHGVDNPIVVGAVPFDWQIPAHLFFPQDYKISDISNYRCSIAEKSPPANISILNEVITKERYKKSVEYALELFQSTPLRKVVLSRPIDIEASEKLSPDRITHALIEQNPGAYVFSVRLAGGQTLIGASPELLVRKTGKQILSNPLAGSSKRSTSLDEDRRIAALLFKSDKDRFEHQLVVDAVEESLAPYCGTLTVPAKPSVISTSTMWHLSTEVKGVLKEESTSSLRLAGALHPTPAICGTPYGLAHKAIQKLEGYSRGMYSGMVGWMDSRGNGEWAVTIRCGVVNHKSLRLYAGAGIVPSSTPEAEWAETSAKLTTMLNAFGLNAPQSDAKQEKLS